MKQWIKYSLPVAMGLVALTASAEPITGTVQMAGSVTFDSTSLSAATSASFSNPAGLVSSGTGSYQSVDLGTKVNFTGFVFAPLGSQNTPIANLWSFTDNGLTYSFDLGHINSVSVSGAPGGVQFLDVEGTGALDITGSDFDTTVANWSFTVTDSSGGTSGSFKFGFSDSNTAAPDGGMTVMMLGAALTGLGLIKRKLA